MLTKLKDAALVPVRFGRRRGVAAASADIAGFAAIAYGAGMIYRPAGFITAGVGALLKSLEMDRRQ